MPQVEIGFRPVVRDEHFPVLDGVHGSGINIDVRVKFLHGHFIAAGF